MVNNRVKKCKLGVCQTRGFGAALRFLVSARSCHRNSERMCLGERNVETGGYDWLSYGQVLDAVDAIGSALAKVSKPLGHEEM